MNIENIISRLSPLLPVTEARISACSHAVEQPNLTREHLGDPAFGSALRERNEWIEANCLGDYVGGAVRSGGVITGRVYRFSDWRDAFGFRMRF
jgi:hypothetical protein